jgi:hypothetical protein
MRLLILLLSLCLHNPASASVYRCEYLLTASPGTLSAPHSLHLDAYMLLTWGLDFTGDIKTPSVASGLSAKALRAFNLEKIAPARYPRLRMTSRFEGKPGAEISLFMNAEKQPLKSLSFRRRDELYFWKRAGFYDDSRQGTLFEFHQPPRFMEGAGWARLPKGAHVGFYPEMSPEYSIYVSVVPLSSRSYQINIGLDVDCLHVGEYIETSRFVEKIKKSGGVKCRIAVLRFKGFAEPQGEEDHNIFPM